MVKQFVTPVVILFSLLILVPIVQADPFGANITWIRESSMGNGTASDYDITEGGNITVLNLSVTQATSRWAGYYGNVSGSMSLSDGTSDFYRWGVMTGDGHVCAGVANNYSWSTLFNISSVSNVDTAWDFSGGSDSAVETFNASLWGTSDTCGNISGSALLRVPVVKTGPDGLGDTFETCVINDAGAANTDKWNMLFCVNTNIVDANNDFRNSGHSDYELLVPTNETAGAMETFYFFLEL